MEAGKPAHPWPRVIAHVDMDAFFAAVEQRDHPQLRGQPIAVGGSGPRSVVATASYEARRYGVHSAMPMVRARQLCPSLIIVPGRHAHYRQVSASIMHTLDSFTPIREAVSVDEAYLDLTGAQRHFDSIDDMARSIRYAVWQAVHLTCSVGIGISMSVAKIASATRKPHGITVVEPKDTTRFLHPLPVSAIGGVGPVMQKKCEQLGVSTVGDIAALPPSTLHRIAGAHGPSLRALALGHDTRPVGRSSRDKSLGKERTFPQDIEHSVRLRAIATAMADEVAFRMRQGSWAARAVSVKMRAGDGRTITRTLSFREPCEGSEQFRERALTAFERAHQEIPRVRLLGVRAEHLVPATGQGQDDLEGRSRAWSCVDRAMDEARRKYGVASLSRAASLGAGHTEARDGS